MNYWAEAMLLWSLQVLVLVLILSLVSFAMRRSSAADRHRLWLVGLIAIAAMPAANLVIRVFPQELPPPEPVRYVTQPVESVITPVPQAAQLPAEPPRTAPQSAPLPRPFDPVPVLFVLWIGGMLIQLTRVAGSYQHSRRLRAAAAIAPAQSLRVPAAHASGIYVPMLAGIFRPVVLLPADIANWAEADELRAMVLHESAHFDRRDHLVNLFQAFVG